jgi:hypothetical protein
MRRKKMKRAKTRTSHSALLADIQTTNILGIVDIVFRIKGVRGRAKRGGDSEAKKNERAKSSHGDFVVRSVFSGKGAKKTNFRTTDKMVAQGTPQLSVRFHQLKQPMLVIRLQNIIFA